MNPWDTVALVGVGLLGGSIGLGLRRKKLARHVVGIGRSAASLRVAQKMGAITESTLDLARGVAEAQLVIVCTPVGRIVDDVRAVAAACSSGTLITDVGSTKEQIVRELDGELPDGIRFVGGHPLAGGEKNGPAAASADLFADRLVILTPTRRTNDKDCASIGQLWTALGARVLTLSPAEHDRLVAAISHLPHLVAAVLAECTPAANLPMAAAGWSDSTRVAAGNPDLWADIFHANRTRVLAALDRYEKSLSRFRRALERDDRAALLKLLEKAKNNRDAVAN